MPTLKKIGVVITIERNGIIEAYNADQEGDKKEMYLGALLLTGTHN